MRRQIFLIGVILFCLEACISDAPNPPGISERKFAELLASVVRLQAFYTNQPDSLSDARESLFKRYEVNRDMLEAYIRQREGRLEDWGPVLLKAKEILDLEAKGLPTGPKSRVDP